MFVFRSGKPGIYNEGLGGVESGLANGEYVNIKRWAYSSRISFEVYRCCGTDTEVLFGRIGGKRYFVVRGPIVEDVAEQLRRLGIYSTKEFIKDE